MSAGNARPLALLGGTFDPVHIGHLRVAWEAAERLDADVRLVPARVPPHRPQPVASAAQRLALLHAALAGQDRLTIDARELDRAGPSYTIDTLAAMRGEIGPERALVLLLGADAFAGLPTWHRWRELFDLAHVGVLTRPGHGGEPDAALEAEIAPRRAPVERALAAPAGRVFALAVSALEISSSRVRALLAAGRDPRFLLPDALLADRALLAAYRDRHG